MRAATPGPVIVDCRMARRRETGGARYARGLAQRLPTYADAPTALPVTGPPPLPRRNALTSVGNLLLDLAWTHIGLPVLALRHRAAAIHSTFNWAPVWAPCPRVVTVHDLSWERMPEAYPAGFRAYARIFTRLAARRCERVIAVSQATAQDIVDLYGVDPKRIDVVYTGIDGIDDGGVGEYPSAGTRETIILHVGEFETRKRVPMLVEGFARFAATPAGAGWRLVLAGRGGPDHAEVQRLADECDGCEMAGFVDDATLDRLYRSAALVVSASRWEGFCLPIAEALHRGCPALVADTPALVEAAGPGGSVMPEPLDAAGIARALEAAVGDPGQLLRQGENGRAHAGRFGWAACLEGTRRVYQRVIDEVPA